MGIFITRRSGRDDESHQKARWPTRAPGCDAGAAFVSARVTGGGSRWLAVGAGGFRGGNTAC